MENHDAINTFYEGLEIHPVCYRPESACYEECEPEEAEQWGLYGQVNTGGLQWLADYSSLAAAEEVRRRLERGLAQPPEETRQALLALQQYLRDEQRPMPDPIFRALAALDRWLFGPEQTAEKMSILDNP